MKRSLLVVGLFFAVFSSTAQTKELTLSDAVLKGYSSLAPESRLDLKIIPGTQNYVYLSKDYQELISGGIKSRQAERSIAAVANINEQLEDVQLKHLYITA